MVNRNARRINRKKIRRRSPSGSGRHTQPRMSTCQPSPCGSLRAMAGKMTTLSFRALDRLINGNVPDVANWKQGVAVRIIGQAQGFPKSPYFPHWNTLAEMPAGGCWCRAVSGWNAPMPRAFDSSVGRNWLFWTLSRRLPQTTAHDVSRFCPSSSSRCAPDRRRA
jgi:hypothetical protein